jgi:nucleoside-diphosphate-sugar epimerase
MRTIDSIKPVLVTGATGYVASWIIKMLLDEGIDVHATVRDPDNTEKVAHLKALAGSSNGNLTLFKADLLKQRSFDDPMRGCQLVIHTASPFFVTGIKNAENELVRPARAGTENVLESALRTRTVKRVVLTSSVAAIFGDNADIRSAPGKIFTEQNWNRTSSAQHNPYAYSKTVAERLAWDIADKQDQWDLLTINPGWILGPSVSKRNDSMSIATMIQFGDGTFKRGVPKLYYGIADVRDVATAHINAGYTPEASGRHIVASAETTLLHIASILRRHFGKSYPFPRKEAPKLLFWLIAPLLGYTRAYVRRNVGIAIKLDTSYSKKDLGITYIPIEQTVTEHFQQILDDGLLVKKR